MKSHFNFIEGEILLINKSLRWTSFDVIKKIRVLLNKELGIKKIKAGHAGTLDPLASGLLIVCTGKSTKAINRLQLFEKEYTGTFALGATTPSYDLETDIYQTFEYHSITEQQIINTTSTFIGTSEQIPPLYSAVNVSGERAYFKARRGEEVQLKPKQITISEFTITNIHLPYVDFRIVCSKGTYIRSLVHDFGKSLNNGSYLSALCRTRIGEYKIEDSWTLDEFEEVVKNLNGTC